MRVLRSNDDNTSVSLDNSLGGFKPFDWLNQNFVAYSNPRGLIGTIKNLDFLLLLHIGWWWGWGGKIFHPL